MPLSKRVFLPVPVGIGNSLNIGGSNPPFLTEQFLNFPYSIESRDYFAGQIRFLYCFGFVVRIDPLAELGSSNGNPVRTRYGTATITNSDELVIEKYELEYAKQQIQYLGHPISLSRNEAARPKSSVLGSRPRFSLSNANSIDLSITGRFAPPAQTYNGGGVITGTTAATFTETGTIFTAATGNPGISIAPRQWKMDVQDGDISFVERPEAGIYYINTPVDNLGDTWRPVKFNLYMEPGVVGNLYIEVFKLTEEGDGNPAAFGPYTPNTSFPPP